MKYEKGKELHTWALREVNTCIGPAIPVLVWALKNRNSITGVRNITERLRLLPSSTVTQERWNVPTLSFCKKTVEEPEKKSFKLHKDLHKPIEDECSTKQSPNLVSSSSNNTVFLHSQLIMEFGGCHKENAIKQLGKNNVILSPWGIYCRAVHPLNLNLAPEVLLCLLVLSLADVRILISVCHHSNRETTPDHNEEGGGGGSQIPSCCKATRTERTRSAQDRQEEKKSNQLHQIYLTLFKNPGC